MTFDPLLVSMGYLWRIQGLPTDNNPSFRFGYELAAHEMGRGGRERQGSLGVPRDVHVNLKPVVAGKGARDRQPDS
jgi:hypothetical protein